jgi:hypothetical protein
MYFSVYILITKKTSIANEEGDHLLIGGSGHTLSPVEFRQGRAFLLLVFDGCSRVGAAAVYYIQPRRLYLQKLSKRDCF